MKLNWHVLAARCAVEHPHWTWRQVCAHVGRRKRAKVTPPVKPDPVALMEKRGLW